MRALSAGELLSVWECGVGRGLVERGLVLLAAACPDDSHDQLLGLTIGQRDLRLARLRELTFGSHLECQIACPSCGQRLELGLATRDVLAPESLTEERDRRAGHVEEAGWRIRFRPIDTRDLIDALDLNDATDARRLLMRRAVVASLSPAGVETDGLPEEGLPAPVQAALFASMERIDRGSSVAVSLECPDCAHAWTAPFDVLSFFWREIEAWAHRTLREVHVLASAYGWNERDILTLPPHRRDAYLQMAGHA